jgi:hypothetical protein
VAFDHKSIKRHEGQSHQSAEMSIIQTDYLVAGVTLLLGLPTDSQEKK